MGRILLYSEFKICVHYLINCGIQQRGKCFYMGASCPFSAPAAPPSRPEEEHGGCDVGGPSASGGPPGRGGGTGNAQALHTQTQVGGLATGGEAKVSTILGNALRSACVTGIVFNLWFKAKCSEPESLRFA